MKGHSTGTHRMLQIHRGPTETDWREQRPGDPRASLPRGGWKGPSGLSRFNSQALGRDRDTRQQGLKGARLPSKSTGQPGRGISDGACESTRLTSLKT